jgi:maltose alpha-D-glucosyltransferase/alpha-amylase
MLRSFHYAAHAAARAGDLVEAVRADAVAPWVRLWRVSASGAYLREYLEVVDGASFAGEAREEARALLPAFVLEKALYEVAYEANHRPDWMPIAVAGFGELLEGGA